MQSIIFFLGTRVKKLSFISLLLIIFNILFAGFVFSEENRLELLGSIGGACNSVDLKDNYALTGQGQNLLIIDTSDANNPAKEAEIKLPEVIRDIFVKDDYAYIADYQAGLQIVDISKISDPAIIGSYQTDIFASKVFVSDNFAFITEASKGIKVIDISDPTNPGLMTSYQNNTGMRSVYVQNNVVYAASPFDGLLIFDFSKNNSLDLLSEYDTTDTLNDVYVNGKYAYLAAGKDGLIVLDIENPAEPQYITSVKDMFHASGIYCSENILYITVSMGIYTVDITDPENPVPISFFEAKPQISDMVKKDNFLIISDSFIGLKIADYSNLSKPDIVSTYNTLGEVRGVYVKNNLAYTACGYSGLKIIDVSSPSNPQVIGSCEIPGMARRVDIKNNWAYVADSEQGIQIINIENPTFPTLTGSYDISLGALCVAYKDNFLFSGTNYNGLQIIDVSSPTTPTLVKKLDYPAQVTDIAIVNNLLYVAAKNIDVYDISYPNNPELKGSFKNYDDKWIRGIFADGNIIYGATFGEGTKIIDFSESSNPKQLALITKGINAPFDVFVKNRLLFVANELDGLSVYDVSYPDSPVSYADFDTIGLSIEPFASGNNVYLADYNNGLQIFGFLDPPPTPTPSPTPTPTATPTPYPPFPTPTPQNINIERIKSIGGTAYSFDFKDNYMFICEGKNFSAVNISPLITPKIVSSIDLKDRVNDAKIIGNYAFVIMFYGGLKVIDISDPLNMTVVSELYLPPLTYKISAKDNFIYVGASSGLYVFDISNPLAPSLINIIKLNFVRDVCFDNNIAFVQHYTGFNIYDISNPYSFVLKGSYACPENYCLSIGVKGQVVYLTTMSNLYAVDIRDLSNPVLLSTLYSNPGFLSLAYLEIYSNYIYISRNNGAIIVVDISNPQSMSQKKVINLESSSYMIKKRDDKIFVSGNFGVQIFEMADFVNLNLYSDYKTFGQSQKIFSEQNQTYLVDFGIYNSKLRIYDTTNPTSPSLASCLELSAATNQIYVENKIAYTASLENITIIDCIDPVSPNVLCSGPIQKFIGNFCVKNEYLYIPDDVRGLKIYDCSSHTSPTLENTYSSAYNLQNAFVRDNLLFVTDFTKDVLVLDITNPVSPLLQGIINTDQRIIHVAFENQYAYLTSIDKVLIWDISNPQNPVFIGQYINTDAAFPVFRKAAVKNSLIYLNYGTALHIIDVTDPANPKLTDKYSSDIYDICLNNGYIYAAARNYGFEILKYRGAPEEKINWETQGNWDCFDTEGNKAPNDIAQWQDSKLICKWNQYPLPDPGFFQWLSNIEEYKGIETNINYQPNSLYILKAKMSADSDDTIPQIRLRVQAEDNVWSVCGLYGADNPVIQKGSPTSIPSDFYLVWEPQCSKANMFIAADIYATTQNTGEIYIDDMSIYRIPVPQANAIESEISDFRDWQTIGDNVINDGTDIVFTDTDTWNSAGSYIKLDNEVTSGTIYRVKYSLIKPEPDVKLVNMNPDQIRLRVSDTFNGAYSSNFVYNDSIAAENKLTGIAKDYIHYHLACNKRSTEPSGDLSIFLDTINSEADAAGVVLSKVIVERIIISDLAK